MSSGLRAAVEARDIDAIAALFADDIVFRSPVAHKPYEGKTIVTAIIANVMEVFEDFRYVRELTDDGGEALVFEARVGELSLTGCDFLVYDERGLITDFMVMVRPLRGAEALAAAMGERFEGIVAMATRLTDAGGPGPA